MHIIRRQDAIHLRQHQQNLSINYWEWPETHGLRYEIHRDNFQNRAVSELYMGDIQLSQEDGEIPLAMAWPKISMILLEHNILCEPLQPSCALPLPQLDDATPAY